MGIPRTVVALAPMAVWRGETQQKYLLRIKAPGVSKHQQPARFPQASRLLIKATEAWGQDHSSWIFQRIFHHKQRAAGHLLSGNPPRRQWFLYPLPSRVQLDRRETVIRSDVSSNGSNGWRGFEQADLRKGQRERDACLGNGTQGAWSRPAAFSPGTPGNRHQLNQGLWPQWILLRNKTTSWCFIYLICFFGGEGGCLGVKCCMSNSIILMWAAPLKRY